MKLWIGCRVKKNRGDTNLGLTGVVVHLGNCGFPPYDVEIRVDSFWQGYNEKNELGFWPPETVWFDSSCWDPIEDTGELEEFETELEEVIG